MADSNDIKAGGAYVEIRGDSSKFEQDMGRFAAKLVGFVTVTRAAFEGVGVAMAAISVESARASGSVTEVYQAELKMNDAIGGVVGSIPLIGGAIRSAMDAFGDKTAIEKAIKNIADVEKRVVQMEKAARDAATETARRRAQLANDPKALAQIDAGQKQQSTEAQRDEAAAVRTQAAQNLSDAQEKLKKQQDELARVSTKTAGFDPFGFSEENVKAMKKKVQTAQDAVDELNAKYKQADAAYQSLKGTAKDSAETGKAEVAAAGDKASQETATKNLDAQKQMRDFITTDDTQRQIDAVTDQYDKMIEAAKKYGGDLEALAVARDARIAEIDRKAQEKQDKENEARAVAIEQEKRRIMDLGEGATAKQQKRDTQKEIDTLAKTNPELAQIKLKGIFDKAADEARKAWEELTAAFERAQADGEITATEREKLNALEGEYKSKLATADDAQAMMDGIAKKVEKDTLEVRGGFGAAALSQAFGVGTSNAQERTAQSAEQMAKYLRDIKDNTEVSMEFGV